MKQRTNVAWTGAQHQFSLPRFGGLAWWFGSVPGVVSHLSSTATRGSYVLAKRGDSFFKSRLVATSCTKKQTKKQAISQTNRQASEQNSKQARKQASDQPANKQKRKQAIAANTQTSRQASKRASVQASRQASQQIGKNKHTSNKQANKQTNKKTNQQTENRGDTLVIPTAPPVPFPLLCARSSLR